MRSAPSRVASRYHRPAALDQADRIDGAPARPARPARRTAAAAGDPANTARRTAARGRRVRGPPATGALLREHAGPRRAWPSAGRRRASPRTTLRIADGEAPGPCPERGRVDRDRGEQRERLVVGQPGQVRGEAGQQREPAVRGRARRRPASRRWTAPRRRAARCASRPPARGPAPRPSSGPGGGAAGRATAGGRRALRPESQRYTDRRCRVWRRGCSHDHGQHRPPPPLPRRAGLGAQPSPPASGRPARPARPRARSGTSARCSATSSRPSTAPG